MKIYSSIILLLLGIVSVLGQNQIIQDSAMVRGNCAMCQSTIEGAIHQLENVDASWNIQTKKLKFTYNSNEHSRKEILKAVADSGYDNEEYLADDEAYNQLPGCCLYDRTIPFELLGTLDLPETHLEEGSGHDHKEMEMGEDHQNHNNKNESLDMDEPHHQDDSTIDLKGITVEGNKAATRLSSKKADLTFNIDKKELLKAACCNLSESFETNATVDVSFANAVTGTKQIKLLGLDQKYSLITRELMPVARGLSVVDGFSFIPGRWINSIQLTKGAGSVTNGYESISGHINTEFVKEEEQYTSINLYGNTNSRVEFNLVEANQLKNNWNQSILLHGNATLDRIDSNDDGFIDNPVGNQINAAYLLNYSGIATTGFGSHFGINWIQDKRIGGQMDYMPKSDRNTMNSYGYGSEVNQLVVWNKTGYVFKNKAFRSIGWMNQFTYHELDNYYGLRTYQGSERSLYSNLIFEDILGSTNHKYKLGASLLLDNFKEDYNQDLYNRNETVPGTFAEYSYTGDKVTAVIGSRIDFHNLAGTQISPRAHIKYDVTNNTFLRLSAGRGFRTANVFAENLQYFASNRNVIIEGQGDIYGLDAETAWNYGISLQQKFKIFNTSSTFVIDYFKTNFDNQILPDLYQSNHEIVFYNSEGKSETQALQAQLDFEPINRLEARLAYKWYKSERDYRNVKEQVPFTPSHRGFLNLAYSTRKSANFQQWTFDSTLQWIGEQIIPIDYSANSKTTSDPYFTLNAQVAWQMNKSIRFYTGVDNITGKVQENPIISAEDPFSDTFDAGMIYAPIMPQNVYFGVDIDLQ